MTQQENVEVLSSKIGRIIGKAGCGLRIIAKSTGATVNVPRAVAGGQDMRTVEISGTPLQLAAAREMILQFGETGVPVDMGTPSQGGNQWGQKAAQQMPQGAGHDFGAQQQSQFYYPPQNNFGGMQGFDAAATAQYQWGGDMGAQATAQNLAGMSQYSFPAPNNMAGQYMGMPQMPEQKSSLPPYTVDVPSSAIGRIIGKAGSGLRNIAKTTGATVNVPRGTPGQEVRQVELAGTPAQMIAAQQMIVQMTQYDPRSSKKAARARPSGTEGEEGSPKKQKLDESGEPIKSSEADEATKTPDAKPEAEDTVEVPSANIGRVIGKAGCGLRIIGKKTGADVNVPRGTPDQTMRTVELSGTTSQVAAARTMVLQFSETGIPIELGVQAPRFPSSGYGMQSQYAAALTAQSLYGAPQYGMQEQQLPVQVPATAMGRIIGKGGIGLRNIAKSTGAKVNVPRGTPGQEIRIVELTGNPGQLALAQQMILSLTQMDAYASGAGGMYA